MPVIYFKNKMISETIWGRGEPKDKHIIDHMGGGELRVNTYF